MFIVAIVLSSIVSRFLRSKELRFEGLQFVDTQSHFLWDSMPDALLMEAPETDAALRTRLAALRARLLPAPNRAGRRYEPGLAPERP